MSYPSHSLITIVFCLSKWSKSIIYMCALNHKSQILKQWVFFYVWFKYNTWPTHLIIQCETWILALYSRLESWKYLILIRRHIGSNHCQTRLESWSPLIVWLESWNCLIRITWFKSWLKSNKLFQDFIILIQIIISSGSNHNCVIGL